jgi:hypothetical protein
MRPVNFKHQNTIFAKDQPQYQQLPTLLLEGPEGHVISCWKLSFMGRIWMSLMTLNKPLTPSMLTVNRKEVYSHPDDSITWYKKIFKND